MQGKTASWSAYGTFPKMRREQVFGSRVVRCFEGRPRSLFELFAEGCTADPGREALVLKDRRLSYAEMDVRIGQAASGLQRLRVVKNTRVALMLENSPEFVILLFAVAKLGAISVPINIREAAPEIAHIINDCSATVLVCADTLVERLPSSDSTPSIKAIEILDLAALEPLGALLDVDELSTAVPVDEADVAMILYTSGTTGRPKGAMLTNINFAHSVLQYRNALNITCSDRSIIAVPMSHVTGITGLILPVLNAGATLIIMKEFQAQSFVDLAATERMTHTILVPAMFALCLLRPDIGAKDLGAWRVSGYGGAIMPEATLRQIDSVLPALKLVNCYGATETSSPVAMMPPEHTSERAHQVGLPVPCADIVVMDDEGHEVERGEIGELWIAGPMVVKGYWENVESTSTGFVGGFWKSGDLGSLDDSGFIRIVDRIKDIINRGGYKVHASEVENVLLTHVAISEAAVVAKSCPVLGERVHAFLVATGSVTAQALTEYCRSELADYKQPEAYHFVQGLPRNANGKVLKRELRNMLEAQA